MHADEVDVSVDLVRRLVAEQFPEWAALPITQFLHGGTDHFIFRLGDGLQARLPKHAPSTGQIEKEIELLPRVAAQVPVEVPQPLAVGAPDADYPFTWGVYRWLPGATPRAGTVALAREVAAFLHALQRIDPAGAPPASRRGGPLRDDDFIRRSIERLAPEFEPALVTSEWERALELPPWDRPPVWLHGDLLPSNLLVRGGRLAVVLDWGLACAGDPACDLMLAWSLLDPVRAAFRDAVGVDDATWARARAWALWQGTNALGYYRDTNPPMAAHARLVLANVLRDR
jgi:aminoglycoside phosphotransferase (APT) family kinase protein